VLIFIVLLSSRRDLMGDMANTRSFSAVAWGTSVAMIVLTLVLVYTALFHRGASLGMP